jgi:exodeoxyribonuclease VII large subunit
MPRDDFDADFDADFDDDGIDTGEIDDGVDPIESVTYSVSELAGAINDVLEDSFDDGVWVWGEITGLSVKGGHTYFTLVEQTNNGKRSQLNVNLWRGEFEKIRPLLRKSGVTLENGLRVRVFGELDFYAPFGKLSLVMRGIDPRFTLGDIAMQREELIRRLRENGDYDRNKDVDWSPVPLRVGVVTSGSSAAWADFVHEIERSELGFVLRLADVSVQGDSAVAQVSRAVQALGRRSDLDVIAVIRGGGSRAELATFDAEAIALTIARSPIPVVTGIGHEIDTSVADEVAHRRFKTPTACAAGLVERVRTFIESSESTWSSIARVSSDHLVDATTSLVDVTHRIAVHTRTALTRADERLGHRSQRLTMSARGTISARSSVLTAHSETVRRRAPMIVAEHFRRIDELETRTRLLDPRELMKRGWSVTRRADGRVLRSIEDVAPDDIVSTQISDGTITSTVSSTNPSIDQGRSS